MLELSRKLDSSFLLEFCSIVGSRLSFTGDIFLSPFITLVFGESSALLIFQLEWVALKQLLSSDCLVQFGASTTCHRFAEVVFRVRNLSLGLSSVFWLLE